MERAYLWLKCAIMHDPVRPVLKRPAAIGWEAKFRQIDLVIERPFKGDELVRRMKGWATVDVYQLIDIINKHGKLRLLDDYDVVVETADTAGIQSIQEELAAAFAEEAWLEYIPKSRLT
ncbi:MAG: hypothetical protein HQK56_12530 [Deltaproteobacteria bacterium]|nr:hypothetical protein [Deltaproteobacteria bacterium]